MKAHQSPLIQFLPLLGCLTIKVSASAMRFRDISHDGTDILRETEHLCLERKLEIIRGALKWIYRYSCSFWRARDALILMTGGHGVKFSPCGLEVLELHGI